MRDLVIDSGIFYRRSDYKKVHKLKKSIIYLSNIRCNYRVGRKIYVTGGYPEVQGNKAANLYDIVEIADLIRNIGYSVDIFCTGTIPLDILPIFIAGERRIISKHTVFEKYSPSPLMRTTSVGYGYPTRAFQQQLQPGTDLYEENFHNLEILSDYLKEYTNVDALNFTDDKRTGINISLNASDLLRHRIATHTLEEIKTLDADKKNQRKEDYRLPPVKVDVPDASSLLNHATRCEECGNTITNNVKLKDLVEEEKHTNGE